MDDLLMKNMCSLVFLRGRGSPRGWIPRTGSGMGAKRSPTAGTGTGMGGFSPYGDGDGESITGGEFPVAIPIRGVGVSGPEGIVEASRGEAAVGGGGDTI